MYLNRMYERKIWRYLLSLHSYGCWIKIWISGQIMHWQPGKADIDFISNMVYNNGNIHVLRAVNSNIWGPLTQPSNVTSDALTTCMSSYYCTSCSAAKAVNTLNLILFRSSKIAVVKVLLVNQNNFHFRKGFHFRDFWLDQKRETC